ncbi:uncharacterized protein LOC126191589 [Schistocerca cancellata]|uniref:uncharacterized protein LOC126191589 n=1 Tax=Schistocerca cancellata TaxID=274614 RepID=UPI00211741ED|nr:uncharacterized protein LOC126191589 [Schistocerca cancellata]
MHKSKSGASAQAAYTPQVYWFHMLKFLNQATELDESVCNTESTESECATPTFEEMFEHEMQEPSVTCSEPQRQPQRKEQSPTKRRKVTTDGATDVMVEASRTLKTVADIARTLPVQEDRYGTLGTHIATDLREMENVGGKEFTTATMHSLLQYLMDRWDLLHATTQAQQAQSSASGYIEAALKQAGIEEEDLIL